MTYILIAIAAILGLAILFLLWLVFIAWRTNRRVEKYLPPIGKYMDANGDRIHYFESGEGKPIVMIHGLNGQMRHFKYSLQERVDNDYHTIIIDRPGCGYSERKSDDASRLTEQAKTIAEFIKKLNLKEKPLIVGHSLGGGVSMALALNHRDVVAGLALIAPLTNVRDTANIPPAFKALVKPSPFRRSFYAWTFAIPHAMKNAKAIMGNVFGPEPVPADTATKGGGLLSLRPRGFYVASTDFLNSMADMPGIVERYDELKDLPIGIIYGTKDQILDYQRNGVFIKETLPHTELELMEDCGHMILMTKPDEVAAFIKRIAARVFGASQKAAE